MSGFDAGTIMGSDEAALVWLSQQKRGEADSDDLRGELSVELGLATEDLNCRWFDLNAGLTIKDRQRQWVHPLALWMAASLDGVVNANGPILEAKFPRPWTFSELTVIKKDMGQI